MEFEFSHAQVDAEGFLDGTDSYERYWNENSARDFNLGRSGAEFTYSTNDSATDDFIIGGGVYPIVVERLFPGYWTLDIEVWDADGRRLIEVEDCEFFLSEGSGGETFEIRVIEGQIECTTETGALVEGPSVPNRDLAVARMWVAGSGVGPTVLYDPGSGTVPGALQIISGSVLDVLVEVGNIGEQVEDFRLELTGDTGGGIVTPPSIRERFGLGVDSATTESFQWDTSTATLGQHELKAFIDEVDRVDSNDRIIAVFEIVDPVSDIDLTSLTIVDAPMADSVATVSGNEQHIVQVSLHNDGEIDEDVSIRLEEAPFEAGAVGTPSLLIGESPALSLPAQTRTAYSFPSWTPAAVGNRALIASVRDSQMIQPVFVEFLDVSISIGTAVQAQANLGEIVSIPVSLTNHGNTGALDSLVRLTATPAVGGDSIEIGEQIVPSLPVADPTEPHNLSFSWDTGCLDSGAYTLDAYLELANNMNPSSTDQAGPVALVIDHELTPSVDAPFRNPDPAQPAEWAIILRITNGRGFPDLETGVDVLMSNVPAGPNPELKVPGNQRIPFARLPANLACGETQEFEFSWYPPGSIFLMDTRYEVTLEIQSASTGDGPGQDDPGDNSVTVIIEP